MTNKKFAGDNIKTQNANWKFSGDVVNKFDAHVKKSVPFYLKGHNTVCELSNFFIKDNSTIYEIGCSTGTLSLTLSKHNKNKKMSNLLGLILSKI